MKKALKELFAPVLFTHPWHLLEFWYAGLEVNGLDITLWLPIFFRSFSPKPLPGPEGSEAASDTSRALELCSGSCTLSRSPLLCSQVQSEAIPGTTFRAGPSGQDPGLRIDARPCGEAQPQLMEIKSRAHSYFRCWAQELSLSPHTFFQDPRILFAQRTFPDSLLLVSGP